MTPLELPVIGLVLLAALGHASWNALTKAGGDRLLSLTWMIGIGSAFGGVAALVVELPARAAWPYLGASVVLHSAYHLFLLRMYHFGDLSQTYPIARGLAPLLVAGISAVAVGEHLTSTQLAGLALACAAITSLAWTHGRPKHDHRRALLAAVATGVMIGMYTVVDGMGVRLAGSAERYIAWNFLLDAIPIVGAALWLRGPGALVRYVRTREGPRTLAGGIIASLAYGIVLWALGQGPMAHVSALRETSVVFAAFIGTHLLGEGHVRPRVLSAVGVALGVILLHVGG